MKRVLALPMLAILLAAFIPNAFAAGGGYQKFTSEAGRFSIWTPVPLREFTVTEYTLVGRFPLHMYLRNLGDWGYMVSYCDYPKSVLRAGAQSLLDRVVIGALITTRSRLVSEDAISLEGYPGEEMVMDSKLASGEVIRSKARIFLVKPRLYIIMAGGGKGEIRPRDMDNFIDSFALLSR